MLSKGKCGIMLSPELAKVWRESGATIHTCADDGIFGLSVKLHGREYTLTAVCVPHAWTTDSQKRRSDMLAALAAYDLTLPSGTVRIYSGDWNSHCGSDMAGVAPLGEQAAAGTYITAHGATTGMGTGLWSTACGLQFGYDAPGLVARHH